MGTYENRKIEYHEKRKRNERGRRRNRVNEDREWDGSEGEEEEARGEKGNEDEGSMRKGEEGENREEYREGILERKHR